MEKYNMSKCIEINSKNFDETVAEGITLVDFWAPWCGPCRLMSPVMDQLAENNKVVKVNTDENQDLTIKLGIRSVPTFMIFKDGSLMETLVGARSKQQFIDIIEKLKDAKGKERSARFVCAMAVAFPNGEIETCRGTIEGLIGYEQKGKNGFGYDPIVYVPEYEMTTGEMAPELKNSISHRGKALEQMKEILKRKLDLN
jgi:thioredoxin